MSGTSRSGLDSFGRVEILEVGRTYSVLSEELVCKALDKDPATGGLFEKPVEELELGPKQEERLADILANEINAILNNFRPNESENGILADIKHTFDIARLKKLLETETGADRYNFRKKFYERMCTRRDPGVGVTEVTHSDETNEYDPDSHPIITVATDFLLDNNRGGKLIPQHVQSRAKKDWDNLQKKAKVWSAEYNMSETEACGEVIAAAIAVEVHTGGNSEHANPYRKFLLKERGATWSQLDKNPTQDIDKRCLKRYKNLCDKNSR